MTKQLNVARRLGPLQFVVIRDFIEARIAEDERRAHAATEQSAAVYHTPIAPVGRLLRECEAKRRILDFTRVDAEAPFEQWFMVGFVMWWLARIWADHPDFDPSWQPTFGP